MEILTLVLAIFALFVSLLTATAMLEFASRGGLQSNDETSSRVDPVTLREHVLNASALDLGLPVAEMAGASLVLVLSPTCVTCRQIASSFDGTVPTRVAVVVTNGTLGPVDRMRAWVSDVGLVEDVVTFDDDRSMVDSIGVTSTPVVIGLAEGRVAFAYAVSSRTAFETVYQDAMSHNEVGFVKNVEAGS